MTWISLVCLLALSGAALGRTSYGSFSGSSLFKPKSVMTGRLPVLNDIPVQTAPVLSSYGSQYASLEQPRNMFSEQPRNMFSEQPRNIFFEQPKPATLPLSEADILCKGKVADFVIVLSGGERFIVCLGDSKGDELFCPKGLLYNDETRRCERKYNPNQNPCASQPCLNGGRCIPTQYSYQCECSQGYGGKTCELDASICQQQQPCGQSFDSFCQSFHVGAALKHVCVLQEGRAYGLTVQQAYPNPCLTGEGLHSLAFGNKGFIICDGEQMFVQSCPGGTIYDSLTKVCVWPEMEGTISINTISDVSSSYSEPTPVPLPTRQLDPVPMIPRKFDFPTQTFGSSMTFPRVLPTKSTY